MPTYSDNITEYSEELGNTLYEKISTSTTSVKKICSDLGVSYSNVRRWIADNTHPFSDMYARAKQLQIEHMAEEILSIADDSTNDTIQTEKGEIADNEWINRSRLRVDTRKWLMSKLNPKKYGDKVDVTSDGEKVAQVFVIGGQEVKF